MLPRSEQKPNERPRRRYLRHCPLESIDDFLEETVQELLEEVHGILERIEKQNERILSRLDSQPAAKHPKYLTVEQVAEQFGRAVWTVRHLCSIGRIPAMKGNDGRWRIPTEVVARFEEHGLPKVPTPHNSKKADSAG